MRYTVLIDGEPGAYGVVFPDLPGCVAMGDTVDEALLNAGDSLRDWMADQVGGGDPPPAPTPMTELLLALESREAVAGGASFAQVSLVRSTGKPVRPNLTLDEGIVSAIDAEAKRRKVTRSAMVEIMAREYLPSMG